MADGYEVAAVFSAPLAAFLPEGAIEIVTDERDGYRLRYGAYPIGEHMVWGATAMMLGPPRRLSRRDPQDRHDYSSRRMIGRSGELLFHWRTSARTKPAFSNIDCEP